MQSHISQMGLLVGAGQEVDPPDRVHDAGRPNPAATAYQRGGSLAGQLRGQPDAQRRLRRVQVLEAERVGDRDDLVEDRPGRGQHLRRLRRC
jgi:hypothetical protein